MNIKLCLCGSLVLKICFTFTCTQIFCVHIAVMHVIKYNHIRQQSVHIKTIICKSKIETPFSEKKIFFITKKCEPLTRLVM